MHQHVHHHDSDHQELTSDKRNAVLQYMLDHNQHHAEELHELAHQAEGEAAELMHQAVELFEQSNEKLEAALQLLKEQA